MAMLSWIENTKVFKVLIIRCISRLICENVNPRGQQSPLTLIIFTSKIPSTCSTLRKNAKSYVWNPDFYGYILQGQSFCLELLTKNMECHMLNKVLRHPDGLFNWSSVVCAKKHMHNKGIQIKAWKHASTLQCKDIVMRGYTTRAKVPADDMYYTLQSIHLPDTVQNLASSTGFLNPNDCPLT